MSQNKGMEAIPSDLIIEILSRLPVKELGKLRCVCKQWYRLLTCNYEFTGEHMKHTKRKPLLLLRRYSSNFLVEVKTNKVSVELTAIDLGGTVINNFRTVVNGPVHTFVSCAALAILCCMKSLYVFNPSTGQGLSVPCSSAAASFYTIGFGYLPQSNEYKIIHLFFVPSIGEGKMRSEILTLRDGEGVVADSWRSIGNCPQSVSASDCLCLNGTVFWEMSRLCKGPQGKEIASFDLYKEDFKVYSYPVCDSTKYSMIGLTGFQGTLCVVGFAAETSTMDVWLMKDNNSGLWVKEYTVGLFCLGAETLIPSDYYSGDILISTKQKDLIKYSIRNQTSTTLSYCRTIRTYRRPCLFYESLFSLHKTV
ncbi:UNVERIFIED_CONTAM: putative F-box protein [Sesamum radiatum]|uniref:F-box protein n=1 Tax=Sesamum radiatum TaxID=300843 RepID=A0AAW2R420_SESRA